MTYDPCAIIPEILGKKPSLGYRPKDDDYQCPFVAGRCVKRSTADKDNPYPVCTIAKKKTGDLVCVCPKRFFQADFLRDVIERVWAETAPENPRIATEVKMDGFGNVDFVIADVNDAGGVDRFLSVELQAIDITGSVRPAYDAILAGEMMEKAPTYGFNWKNVYKRYVHQLIAKGYFHHQWGNKIVSVIQDEVYNYMQRDTRFMVSSDLHDPNINIIFLVYGFDVDPGDDGLHRMRVVNVAGTSHGSLQTAVLYKSPLPKEDFEQRILDRLV